MSEDQKLAAHGGEPTITEIFERYNPIGSEEENAAVEVIRSGRLSGFIGAWVPEFYGGNKVKQFESDCQSYFNVDFAISVNSWTSGLIAAVGALDIEPGDEIITSTWTMSATAMAILHWNAIPVFADIDENTYCIDPSSIRKNITSRTRAIIAVDIFGQSADYVSIRKIADEFNLIVISDTAQAPGSKVDSSFSGTLADIGGFSLNYHKHINTGEGGVLVTNNQYFAERMQLIRNHAESVVSGIGAKNISNMIGYNFRLGEIEAAIASEQLKKLDSLVERRQQIAMKLTKGFEHLPGLITPFVSSNSSHVYYKYAMQINPKVMPLDKGDLVNLLKQEGVPGLTTGYVNVHLLPIFQEKIAYGKSGYPWKFQNDGMSRNYSKGICPTAEKLQDETYFAIDLCEFEFSDLQVDKIISAFVKVWNQLEIK